MPGKARRVASRQAQLGRRRKRQQKGPSGVSLPDAGSITADGEPSTDAGLQAPDAVDPVPSPSPAPAPAPVVRSPALPRSAMHPSSSTFARVRGERPPAQAYIGAELKRILVMAGSVLVVILVLGTIL